MWYFNYLAELYTKIQRLGIKDIQAVDELTTKAFFAKGQSKAELNNQVDKLIDEATQRVFTKLMPCEVDFFTNAIKIGFIHEDTLKRAFMGANSFVCLKDDDGNPHTFLKFTEKINFRGKL